MARQAADEEPPKQAGSEVPTPKRTKTVAPEYPPEAQAQGLRGIVILELVIDATGKVASVDVVRSIPPFDEAAVAAVRQWEYEVTKLDGKPVRVRMTVPISFALRLPEMKRQEGIPELRQGAAPMYPQGGQGSSSVVAQVTLDADGRVGEAEVQSGSTPWAEALLYALRTWRFNLPSGRSQVSFRVEAAFMAASGGQPARVNLELKGLQESESFALQQAPPPAPSGGPAAPASDTPAEPAAAAPASAPTPPPAPAPTPLAPVPTPAQPNAQVPSPPAPAPEPPRPAAPPATVTAQPSPPPASAAGTTPAAEAMPPPPSPPPASTPTQPAPRPRPSPAKQPAPPAQPDTGAPAGVAAPPPVETISAPPPPAPAGVSALPNVMLGSGVPDLVRGRRPVPPPLARMAGTTGMVEVRFSVDAAGQTSFKNSDGPDLLKPAAEEAVRTWSFRRTTTERLHMVASFNYSNDAATVLVNLEP